MLLVTFHGGKTDDTKSTNPPINNVYVYPTSVPQPDKPLSTAALEVPSPAPGQPEGSATLSELRGLYWFGGQLYVVNGSKSISNVLVYQHSKGPSFVSPQVMIAATIETKPVKDKGDGPNEGVSKVKESFTTSIAHPFAVAFVDPKTCFVSNQDTNVVAKVVLQGQPDDNGQLGVLNPGGQSAYLNGLKDQNGQLKYDQTKFLDGTFVASKIGNLHGVKSKNGSIPDVDENDGGLDLTPDKDPGAKPGTKPEEKSDADPDDKKPKPLHSVRDVVVVDGVLYVCDEANSTINIYNVADGTYLGRTDQIHDVVDPSKTADPTHFAFLNGGIWISAGANLFWMKSLPNTNPVTSSPTITAVSLGAANPKHLKLGGISFKTSGGKTTVFIPLQTGTGGNNPGGTIIQATVTQPDPNQAPTLVNSSVFVTNLTDTPEFVLYIHDGK